MKKILRYDFGIARLEVQGLPDTSLGHSINEIGIILSWRLNLIGFPELEGKKEHLETFLRTVLEYSRNYISGVRTVVGSPSSLIYITPTKNRHQFSLRSSKEGVKPLIIYLDDAELIDLTKCFDQLKADQNILIDWDLPLDQPLKRSDLGLNKKALKGFFFPVLGCFTLFLSSIMLLNIPIEDSEQKVITTQEKSLKQKQ